jgi:hypothetical protein
MPFETRIRELSEQLAHCHDDAEALKLAQEFQMVVHEHIEQLRSNTKGLPLLQHRTDETP